jgi:hypothetical protein
MTAPITLSKVEDLATSGDHRSFSVNCSDVTTSNEAARDCDRARLTTCHSPLIIEVQHDLTGKLKGLHYFTVFESTSLHLP